MKKSFTTSIFFLLACSSFGAFAVTSDEEREEFVSCGFAVASTDENEIGVDQVVVTSGDLRQTASGFFSTNDGGTRATVRTGYNETQLKLSFRYRGPSVVVRPFGSGLVRRQIGLKLANANPCNLLYVIWELEEVSPDGSIKPRNTISILRKSNPSSSSSSECGNERYSRLATTKLSPMGVDANDQKTHRLAVQLRPIRTSYDATLNDYTDFRLSVCVDRTILAVQETLENFSTELRGPAGVRTDNGNFIFKMYAV